MTSVYLASPLGFAESTRTFMEHLLADLRRHIDVHNPWDEASFSETIAGITAIDHMPERVRRLAELNHRIGHANREGIDNSDALFAILDGVDVDSGTAAEVGYAFARGKRIWGLRTDFRLAGDNHGAIVNLQVEYFIRESGGAVVTAAADLVAVAVHLGSMASS